MKRSVIPVKPETVTWTDDQWKAIHAKNQDILVAAAAGSGKTAVLVERIIGKIISEEEPFDVDRLLVVTFTNASAAEMRHRIGEALEKAISQNPSSVHLRKQLSLLNRASISTLHSFCLEVIRKYYYLIDIDPGFRIADGTEGELLRDEVLDDLFEEEYGKEGNEPFYLLVDTFTNDRSDAALQDMVRKLYDFSRSHPFPDQWLDELVSMYDVNDGGPIEELPFYDAILWDLLLQFEGAKSLLQEAYELTKLPGGPAPRAENYLDDMALVDRLITAGKTSWNELYLAMNTMEFNRAKACRGDDFNKDLVKSADDLRKKAKTILEKQRNELFSRKPETFLNDMQKMKGVISSLVELVKTFGEKFKDVKEEKGLVDFSDLEHYCLEILMDSDDPNTPSEAAKSYRSQFKEVLVDEYQDTNMVQETILQLVSAERDNGNLFMVGDVKQSIYRFRLAEPNLFLNKYNAFDSEGEGSGLKIDLAMNFRSRNEVLAGTNYLFKQIMGMKVGEIEYDENAELKLGASYPQDETYPIELHLIDLEDESGSAADELEDQASPEEDLVDLEKSQLEARWMAAKIKELIDSRKQIYDPKRKAYRPIQYKDIVLLLRSMPWAPVIMEEFKEAGIPIYANLATGYFDATEITIMLSLLKVIDNPYQDIPLASVLRSPIVGLSEKELAAIRSSSSSGAFYDAVKAASRKNHSGQAEGLNEKLQSFLSDLSAWRTLARQGALSQLIWQLYRDTKFYDFSGGLPGGKQRQANLRALYDRARQYESTSFRGLFRFLRFIDRMRERGDDLGTARALSEGEDVVRLMTIHSSKGLEFPVVFMAGVSRNFNMMDLNASYLLDKDLGFASKYMDPEKRITYPSLPQIAFKRKKKLETIAEEMRVLYVALTRAKEKLYLVASPKNLEKSIQKWAGALSHQDWLLKDYDRASAKSYLDWIGPSMARHSDLREFLEGSSPHPLLSEEIASHESRWHIEVHHKSELHNIFPEPESENDGWIEAVQKGQPLKSSDSSGDKIDEVLSWKYPYQEAAKRRSKQSVSELKRMLETRDAESDTSFLQKFQKPVMKRPKFMQEQKLSPAERGTAMHMVMQHIPFGERIDVHLLNTLLEAMVEKELLSIEQKEAITIGEILSFFETDLGRKMAESSNVHREIPFSIAVPANEIYTDWNSPDESVLVQGIIDCVIEEPDGLVLIDYKTDNITDRFKGKFEDAKPVLENRYRVQLEFYEEALRKIWKKPIKQKFLFFFDGAHILEL
ncbi:helicase-exonuclease AddAB subunit AddA [Falsibacillus pallidus]|uniref:ATP-dependent helicase/nuclease subunit A n=1 Tax=Falsibacillus pallidus TaxID=493781 RepID=A0A370GWD1_9BACI|nr:helicase-exonuclease AddAB subunit AddA [Falsibacillus pallidus]RDI47819.1 DNA helicase/exodeoxyribonuclease V subunit A [Falsibacillus pallidus]